MKEENLKKVLGFMYSSKHWQKVGSVTAKLLRYSIDGEQDCDESLSEDLCQNINQEQVSYRDVQGLPSMYHAFLPLLVLVFGAKSLSVTAWYLTLVGEEEVDSFGAATRVSGA